jgi:hypothetical protein
MGVAENDDVSFGKRPPIAGNEVPVEVLVGPAEEIIPDLVQKAKGQTWAAMDEHQPVAIQIQVDSLGQMKRTQGPVSQVGVASHGQDRGDVAQFSQDVFFVEVTGVQDEVHLTKDCGHLLRKSWQVIGNVGIGQHTDA